MIVLYFFTERNLSSKRDCFRREEGYQQQVVVLAPPELSDYYSPFQTKRPCLAQNLVFLPHHSVTASRLGAVGVRIWVT